ncbi:hypothetical protein C7402_101104 [Paraburkholderia unamae]|uniref:Uncharacterized protein n=1 Tax=Paraburkholderia unamae TaxID=219649 RepID=A0ABX5KUQ5_9BURK|nr:hypothetical protein C7402_101104 [Paraburkholderia unamae]
MWAIHGIGARRAPRATVTHAVARRRLDDVEMVERVGFRARDDIVSVSLKV